MTIRPIEVSDLPAIEGLVDMLAAPGDHDRFAEKWLGGWPGERDRGVVAIDDDGRIVGVCLFRPVAGPDKAPEIILAVSYDHQRQGVGRTLLESNLAQAKELGLWALQAVVKPTNDGALRLLSRYDFRVLLDDSPRKLDGLLVLDDQLQT